MKRSHYETLGVERSASPTQLRAAYVSLARALHPDTEGGDASLMAEVNEAWHVLGDAARRRRYDFEIDIDAGSSGSHARPDPPPWRPYDSTPSPPPMPAEDVAAPSRAQRARILVPVALFGGAVACFCLGAIAGSPLLLAGAIVLLFTSAFAFVLAPMLSMFESIRHDPDRVRR